MAEIFTRRSRTRAPHWRVAPNIRAPGTDELEALRDIERAAGALFLDTKFADVAAHEPATVAELDEYARNGHAWVVTENDDNAPLGYAVVDIVDGLAHLEQLSVSPDHGRRGLGRVLLEHVGAWAKDNGYAAVTLTTFTTVEWNAPFYARHGFRTLTDDEIGPELTKLRVLEATHGLDPAQRVCMRRDLDR